MKLLASDQAESLRRLLVPKALRRVAVVASSPRAGATTVALGLANAMAMQGERVLLVDEDSRSARATRLAHAAPRGRLADVLAGKVALQAAIGDGNGLAVLPGEPNAWGSFDTLHGYRTLLCDARMQGEGVLSCVAGSAHNFVIVMGADAEAVKAAYACIKRLHHQYACRDFHLVVNGLAGNDAAVTAMTANLARTASQYLGVQAACAGVLPQDPLIERASALGRCVVEAFPGAPATAVLRRIASGVAAWTQRSEQTPAPGAHAATPSTVTAF
jgi:flagellar biosynthesis protein FlhG